MRRTAFLNSASLIPLVFFALLVCCVPLALATEGPSANEVNRQEQAASPAQEQTVITPEFVRELVNDGLEADEALLTYYSKRLAALSDDQLNQIVTLLKADLKREVSQIFPERNNMHIRISHWLINYIDDHFGLLEYDKVLDGYLGPVDEIAEGISYAFESIDKQKYFVVEGLLTLFEYDGVESTPMDLECYPSLVRVFVRQYNPSTPNTYVIAKVSLPGQTEAPVSSLKQCTQEPEKKEQEK